jgi:hypothetical protein
MDPFGSFLTYHVSPPGPFGVRFGHQMNGRKIPKAAGRALNFTTGLYE